MEQYYPPQVAYVLIFWLGAAVGSFLNVVIHRLPLGMSVVSPRSACPSCKKEIPGWWNIPIISWVLLRGKCRYCPARISVRYLLVEALVGLLFMATFARWGYAWATPTVWAVCGALVAITFIDIAHFYIPDGLSLPLALLGVLLRPWLFDVPWWDGLLGALIGANLLRLIRWVFLKLRGVEGMGMGDLKLLAMIGAFVGPWGILPVLLIASTTGSVVGIAQMIYGLIKPEEEQPDSSQDYEEYEVPPPKNPLLKVVYYLLLIFFGEAFVSIFDQSTEIEEEDEWVPPPRALPFGPYLAIGALVELLAGPVWARFMY